MTQFLICHLEFTAFYGLNPNPLDKRQIPTIAAIMGVEATTKDLLHITSLLINLKVSTLPLNAIKTPDTLDTHQLMVAAAIRRSSVFDKGGIPQRLLLSPDHLPSSTSLAKC